MVSMSHTMPPPWAFVTNSWISGWVMAPIAWAWVSNYRHRKYVIAENAILRYEWMSNYKRQRTVGVITYPCPNLSEMFVNEGCITMKSNEHNGIWHHRQFDCLSKYLPRLTTKKYPNICFIGPLWGASTGNRWMPLTKGKRLHVMKPLYSFRVLHICLRFHFCS